MWFAAILILSLVAQISGTKPVPDTSASCLGCKAFVNKLDITWTNATTVAEILQELDTKCTNKYTDPEQVKLCQGIANIFVQIPPALFKGMEDLAWPIPEAFCATLMQCHLNCCGNNDPPEQVHLSIASTDRSIMGVTWVSLSQARSVVQYGLNAKQLTSSQEGSIDTYKSGGWVGTIHRAVMKELAPGTTYYYRVGDGDKKWSEVFSFKTLVEGQDINYGLLADIDFEQDITINNMIKLVQDGKVDVILINGDQSYADGYEPHWDVFFNKIQPMAARVPVMVTPGNHEFWYNFSAYKHRYFLPGVLDEGGSGDGMFYSMNVGSTHFIAGNSETAIDTANFSSSFTEFMRRDLAAVNRTAYPSVIVYFHRPMYCSNDGACTSAMESTKLKKQAEDIFQDNRVNLVLTAHIHGYERTFPIYQEVASQRDYVHPQAPTYVMMGASGNREGNKGPYHDVPDWSAFNDQSVGFVVMAVTRSQIDFSFFAARAESAGGPVLKDHFAIDL